MDDRLNKNKTGESNDEFCGQNWKQCLSNKIG